MSHASRFALIAALALKGATQVKASHTYATPTRCQGARVNLIDATLTPAERAKVASELAAKRAEMALARPVNFVLVGSAY